MGMRFHSMYSDAGQQSLTHVTTPASFRDTVFAKQPDAFWNTSWLNMLSGVALGQARRITQYLGGVSNTYNVEFDMANTPSVADLYEILDTWSPMQVNNAINEALRNAWPSFFDEVEAFPFCICEQVMEYGTWALGRLAKQPAYITALEVERPGGGTLRDVVVSATTATIVVANLDLTGVDSKWMVSVYSPGSAYNKLGTVRPVASVVPATKTITVTPVYNSLEVQPDAGQKVMLWDASRQHAWYPMIAVDQDATIWPSEIRLLSRYQDHFPGHRVRVRYIAKPTDLATDTDLTPVPMNFIIAFARSRLYALKKDDDRFDRAVMTSQRNDYAAEAEAIRQRDSWQLPGMTLWQESDDALPTRQFNDAQGNPLGW